MSQSRCTQRALSLCSLKSFQGDQLGIKMVATAMVATADKCFPPFDKHLVSNDASGEVVLTAFLLGTDLSAHLG